MDIEDEFCLRLDESTIAPGSIATVEDLENLVLRLDPAASITALMNRIPTDGPDGKIDPAVYATYWQQHRALPPPRRCFGLWGARYSAADIRSFLSERLTACQDPDAMRTRIRTIIRAVLDLSFEVQPHHHLHRDLGCG